MRWADLGPTPGQAAELVDEVLDRTGVERHGRSVSESGSGSVSAPASVAEASSTPPKPGRPPGTPPSAEAGHAAEGTQVDGAHRRALHLVDLGDGVVEGGEHEVLEHGHVVGVDGLGADGDVEELHGAGDGDLHRAAARATGDLGLGRLGLGVHELALHLHGLVQQGVDVELVGHGGLLRGKGRFDRWRSGGRRRR